MRAFGLFLIVLFVVIIVVTIVVALRNYNKRAWELAVQDAKWEDYATTSFGETEIGVRLVAKRGRRRKVLKTEVLYYIDCKGPDWMSRVYQKQFEAANHADVLNGVNT